MECCTAEGVRMALLWLVAVFEALRKAMVCVVLRCAGLWSGC
jgi:hypothetical protein